MNLYCQKKKKNLTRDKTLLRPRSPPRPSPLDSACLAPTRAWPPRSASPRHARTSSPPRPPQTRGMTTGRRPPLRGPPPVAAMAAATPVGAQPFSTIATRGVALSRCALACLALDVAADFITTHRPTRHDSLRPADDKQAPRPAAGTQPVPGAATARFTVSF